MSNYMESTETPPCSSQAEGKWRTENERLTKTILLLQAEIERLRRKLESTWGEA